MHKHFPIYNNKLFSLLATFFIITLNAACHHFDKIPPLEPITQEEQRQGKLYFEELNYNPENKSVLYSIGGMSQEEEGKATEVHIQNVAHTKSGKGVKFSTINNQQLTDVKFLANSDYKQGQVPIMIEDGTRATLLCTIYQGGGILHSKVLSIKHGKKKKDYTQSPTVENSTIDKQPQNLLAATEAKAELPLSIPADVWGEYILKHTLWDDVLILRRVNKTFYNTLNSAAVSQALTPLFHTVARFINENGTPKPIPITLWNSQFLKVFRTIRENIQPVALIKYDQGNWIKEEQEKPIYELVKHFSGVQGLFFEVTDANISDIEKTLKDLWEEAEFLAKIKFFWLVPKSDFFDQPFNIPLLKKFLLKTPNLNQLCLDKIINSTDIQFLASCLSEMNHLKMLNLDFKELDDDIKDENILALHRLLVDHMPSLEEIKLGVSNYKFSDTCTTIKEKYNNALPLATELKYTRTLTLVKWLKDSLISGHIFRHTRKKSPTGLISAKEKLNDLLPLDLRL